MVNTPTFLPGQTYIITRGFMKHVIVFVIDLHQLTNNIFYKISPLCYEGHCPEYILAKHLVKYEFFPEDEFWSSPHGKLLNNGV